MSEFDFDTELLKVYTDMKTFSYRYQQLQDFEREDLIHETMLRILEKRHIFKIEGEYKFYKFKGWCLRIMHNTFINMYRANKRHGVESCDENPSLLFTNEPLTYSADEEIITKELYDIILRIERNEINRKIFFGYMNGVSYEALSEIFDMPIGTLKSRLFYIRRKIKQVLTKL